MPRDQVGQDQCRLISSAGPGRSDLVLPEYRKTLRLGHVPLKTSSLSFLATSQPVKSKRTKKTSQMARSIQNTHTITIVPKLSTRCSAESSEEHLHRTKMPASSSSTFFFKRFKQVSDTLHTHSQIDKTDVANALLHTSLVLRFFSYLLEALLEVFFFRVSCLEVVMRFFFSHVLEMRTKNAGRSFVETTEAQGFFLSPITTTRFCFFMCSWRLMKVVSRCQNLDALRSALWEPATSQNLTG